MAPTDRMLGGGINWAGPTTCVTGYTCVYSNPYYSQCVPGSGVNSKDWISECCVLSFVRTYQYTKYFFS